MNARPNSDPSDTWTLARAWQSGQSAALDHWDIAQGRDVGSVTAAMTGQDDQRREVPYDVTFAFAVFAFHPEIVIAKD